MKKALALSITFLLGIASNVYADIEVQSGHSEKINDLKFSPDNKLIATASNDHTLKIWDIFTGKELSTLKGSITELNNIYFSPDNKMIASLDTENNLKIWNITDNTFSKNIKIKNKIFDLNKYWSILAYVNQKNIVLQDFKTNKIVRQIITKTNISKIKFTDDNKYLLSGHTDGSLNIWKLSDGKISKTIKVSKLPVKDIFVDNKNSKIVSYNSNNEIRYWDFKTGKSVSDNNLTNKTLFSENDYQIDINVNNLQVKNLKQKKIFNIDIASSGIIASRLQSTNRLSFALNNNFLAISSDKSWFLFDLKTGKNIYSRDYYADKVDSVSARGKFITFSTQMNNTGIIKQWDLSTGTVNIFSEQNNQVSALEYNPDGELMASGSTDGSIKLWKVSDKSIFQSVRKNTQPITSITFDNQNLYFSTGSTDNSIKIWSIGAGTELITLSGHTAPISSLSFNDNSELLLSSSFDKSILLWDVIDAKILKRLQLSASVNSAKFSPDGTYFAAVTGDAQHKNIHDVIMWDLKSGKQINVIKDHSAKVNSLVFNRDGSMMATGGADQRIIINEPIKANKLVSMDGHTNEINYLYFSPPARNFLVSSAKDNMIKLWNLSNGKEIATLISFKDNAYLITTPDGYYMGSEGIEKYVELIDKNKLSKNESAKKYNRPDIVLERIGYASDELIQKYKEINNQ